MKHYCGMDLHSNNHVVVVIDEEDRRVYEKRLRNDLNQTLKALEPYRNTLQGIAVELRWSDTGLLQARILRPPGHSMSEFTKKP